ncbi:MAG: protein kinase [Verrucomicrobia bacterium]|nr:protein kinase [Verrucomicrobiota bacterium]
MDGLAEKTPAPADCAVFGHYQVRRFADGSLDELGRGAMGVTYRGFDPGLRKSVAVKVIAAAYVHDESTRRRFQREARAAAQLTHPHVAGVLHLGEQDGQFFYAMEFVAGRPLSDLLRAEKALTSAVALALLAQVAGALGAAHKRELIHRDLKPANLMLLEGEAIDHDDERIQAAGGRQVKVVDFGLARSFGRSRAEDSLATHSTQAAAFTGTPAYASPEQCAGVTDLDGRSDLYSVGIILWQCLAGRLPFVGSPAQVLGMQQFQPPPFEQLAGQPAALVELLRNLLEKDPERRQPRTAGELRERLDRLRRELATPEPPVTSPPARDISAGSSLGLGETRHPSTVPGAEALPADGTARAIPSPAPPPLVSPLAQMAKVLLLGAMLLVVAWVVRDRWLPQPGDGRVDSRSRPTPPADPTPVRSEPTSPPRPTPPASAEARPRRVAGLALQAVDGIESPATRAQVLTALGVGHALARWPEAPDIFLRAQQNVVLVSNPSEKSDLLHQIGRAMRPGGEDGDRLGVLLAAREAAGQIGDSLGRSLALQQLASSLAKEGQTALARETLQLIPAGGARDLATSQIAADFVRRGQLTLAQQAAREIVDAAGRASVLQRVAAEQAELGDIAGARRTLAEIPAAARFAGQDEEVTLWEVRTLAKAGHLPRAAEAAGQLRLVHTRVLARIELALARTRAGDRPGAITTFGAAKNWAAEATPTQQVDLLCRLAKAQGEAGESDDARTTLLAARAKAMTFGRGFDRGNALAQVAETQAQIGDPISAEVTLGEIGDAEANWRVGPVLALAHARARLKDFEAARKTAQLLAPRSPLRARLGFAVAMLQAWQPGGPEAVELWAGALGEPSERAAAWAGLLQALARQQQGQKAFAESDLSVF